MIDYVIDLLPYFLQSQKLGTISNLEHLYGNILLSVMIWSLDKTAMKKQRVKPVISAHKENPLKSL